MLKISETRLAGERCRITLEGRIVGPWVEALHEFIESRCSPQELPILDLGEVSFADPEGVRLLKSLQQRGVPLCHPSPFLTEQLKAAGSIRF